MSSGTQFTLSNLRRNFVPNMDDGNGQLMTYIASAYYKLILCGKKITINGKIVIPTIPPTEDLTHPWPVYKINVSILKDTNNNLSVYYKSENKAARPYNSYYDESKRKWVSKCIKLAEYEEILENKDLIEIFEFNATKTQGCGSQTSNGGSINRAKEHDSPW